MTVSVDKEQKVAEKKRRETEREQILASAGLKIRRQAPGIPLQRKPTPRRRRPAPAVPKRMPPGGGQTSSLGDATHFTDQSEPDKSSEYARHAEYSGEESDIQVQDAYARYEQFLSDSRNRRASQVRSPAVVNNALPLPQSPPISVIPASRLQSAAQQSSTGSSAGGSNRLSGFFSFMGVSGGHSPAPEHSRPKISGPIVSGPIAGGPIGGPASTSSVGAPEPSTSDDFGKTWSSLVGPSVAATMSDMERKRQESIFEFIATESTYVRDLQLIVGVFYAKMMTILDERELTVVFANVEDILMFNTGFLSSLEDRQKSCRLYIDTIGDVLETHLINLDVYRPYSVNQDTAARLLVQLRNSNPQLENVLRDIRENDPTVRGLDLSSFLLQPMQRLTRYPLLLKQIAHYTAPDQDLDAIQRARSSAERTVARINEDVREAESRDRLKTLSHDLWIGVEGRLDLTEPTQYQGPRRLLVEGTVTKAKSGRKLLLVLCTDIILLIENRNLYRMPIRLCDVALQVGRDELSFALIITGRNRRDTIGLKAQSRKERIEWVGLITRACNENVSARKNAAATESVRSSFQSDRTVASSVGPSTSPVMGSRPQRSRTRSMLSADTAFDSNGTSRMPADRGHSKRYSMEIPPPRASRPTTYDIDQVYDDAHSYAGKGNSMYEHEF